MLIENLMYIVLSVQIYFVAGHILKVAVTVPGFEKYLWLFAIGITAFFWLIIYAAKPGKLITLIFSFLLGFALSGINSDFNVFVFLFIYLYLAGKLLEKHLFTKRRAVFLSSILLLGLIPIRTKGIFEVVIDKKIYKLLYSTGGTVGNSHPNGNFAITIGKGAGSFHKIGTLSKSVLSSSKSLEWLLISFAVLILFAIVLMFLVKFYLVSKNKKAFIAGMVIGISVIAGVVALSSFLFFSMVKLYNNVVSSIQNSSPDKIPPSVNSGGLKEIIQYVTGSNQFLGQIGKTIRIIGGFVVILAVLMGVFFVYIIWKILFVNDEKGSLFSKEERKIYENRIKKKGISRSLSEIKDSVEYVKFLYFSAIYLLEQKGYIMEKFETPNEFSERIFRLLEKPISNFGKLTEIFNLVKYGNGVGISIEKIKKTVKPSVLLEEIKGLPEKSVNLSKPKKNAKSY